MVCDSAVGLDQGQAENNAFSGAQASHSDISSSHFQCVAGNVVNGRPLQTIFELFF
jgi:hypothetical protein